MTGRRRRRRQARYQAPKRGGVVELHGLADVPLAVVEPTVDGSDSIYGDVQCYIRLLGSKSFCAWDVGFKFICNPQRQHGSPDRPPLTGT